jgi:hypothetical protein
VHRQEEDLREKTRCVVNEEKSIDTNNETVLLMTTLKFADGDFGDRKATGRLSGGKVGDGVSVKLNT